MYTQQPVQACFHDHTCMCICTGFFCFTFKVYIILCSIFSLEPSGSAAKFSDQDKQFPSNALALQMLTGDQLANTYQ